eukprot:8619174-Pyramimonas_sp.AAC.1
MESSKSFTTRWTWWHMHKHAVNITAAAIARSCRTLPSMPMLSGPASTPQMYSVHSGLDGPAGAIAASTQVGQCTDL